jgi:hypothetical protein
LVYPEILSSVFLVWGHVLSPWQFNLGSRPL